MDEYNVHIIFGQNILSAALLTKELSIWDSSQFPLLGRSVWNGLEQIIQEKTVIIAEIRIEDPLVHGVTLLEAKHNRVMYHFANVSS